MRVITSIKRIIGGARMMIKKHLAVLGAVLVVIVICVALSINEEWILWELGFGSLFVYMLARILIGMSLCLIILQCIVFKLDMKGTYMFVLVLLIVLSLLEALYYLVPAIHINSQIAESISKVFQPFLGIWITMCIANKVRRNETRGKWRE